jgi:glutamate synthase domain-containing protein 3
LNRVSVDLLFKWVDNNPMNTQMTTSEAFRILQTIGTSFGTGMLEVVMYMRDNLEDFSEQEQCAFHVARVAIADMSKLFV